MARTLDQILDLARWAPSGDNTQPWRFEIIDGAHVVIHGVDTAQTRANCVYDLDGHPTQLSLGALIETLAIAATGFGLRAEVTRRPQGAQAMEPIFDVRLLPDSSVQPSPLIAAIPRRSVQRRAFQTRALTAAEKIELERCLNPGYRIRWFEGSANKWRLARLMFQSAKIRLTIEEAYQVHKSIIAWGHRYSIDRVPDQSLGADPVALWFMRWAMRDWPRVQFLNRFFAGTWLPRLQMDLLPALRSGAHAALLCDHPPESIDDYVAAGRCVQRFWLTATSLGLQKQPEITPLIFSRFAREGRAFTKSGPAMVLAQEVAAAAERVIGGDLPNVVWLARLGHAPAASARSQRRSRADLSISAAGGGARPVAVASGDNLINQSEQPSATP